MPLRDIYTHSFQALHDDFFLVIAWWRFVKRKSITTRSVAESWRGNVTAAPATSITYGVFCASGNVEAKRRFIFPHHPLFF